MPDQSIQQLRIAAAMAASWLTPGETAPAVIEDIVVPNVDLDGSELAVLLRAALRNTA